MATAVDFVRGDFTLPSEPHGLDHTPHRWRFFTLMANRQGDQWSSLCLETGLSSAGATADEALSRLWAAVTDALEHDYGLADLQDLRVCEPELDEWLDVHRGNEPVVTRVEVLDEFDLAAG